MSQYNRLVVVDPWIDSWTR